MINFDAVDFIEPRSDEVISFFWRSVYFGPVYNHVKIVTCGEGRRVGGGGGGSTSTVTPLSVDV